MEDFDDTSLIVLEDEDGNEHLFEIYGSVDVEGQLYTILVPEGTLDECDDDEEMEVVVARVQESEDPESDSVTFTVVEDEAEFQAVIDAWDVMEEDVDDDQE